MVLIAHLDVDAPIHEQPSLVQIADDLCCIGIIAGLFRHGPGYPWKERGAHQHISFASTHHLENLIGEIVKDAGHRFGWDGAFQASCALTRSSISTVPTTQPLALA